MIEEIQTLLNLADEKVRKNLLIARSLVHENPRSANLHQALHIYEHIAKLTENAADLASRLAQLKKEAEFSGELHLYDKHSFLRVNSKQELCEGLQKGCRPVIVSGFDENGVPLRLRILKTPDRESRALGQL